MSNNNDIVKEYSGAVWHGSDVIIEDPDLKHSRLYLDFGKGFYLTKDRNMARKWASTKIPSILNEYSIELSSQKVYMFNADSEWLHFVAANRKGKKIDIDYSSYDVLIGPTADDKLFDALNDYLNGLLSEEITLKIINGMHFSNQILLKSKKALESLKYIGNTEIKGLELSQAKDLIEQDRRSGSRIYKKLRQQFIGGTYYGS